MTAKKRYSVNEDNQLLLASANAKNAFEAAGVFVVNSDNGLSYEFVEPAPWSKGYTSGSKIRFKGAWQLNSDHNLVFVLDDTASQYGSDTLELRTDIVSVDRDELTFELKSVDKKGNDHIYLLSLSGSWQADEKNRLSFVLKNRDSQEVLVFKNEWQVNKRQHIIYRYERQNLKTKRKQTHTIEFIGFWRLTGAHRLSYHLEASSSSAFDFRAQIETNNLYPARKVIKFRLGAAFKKSSRQKKRVCLFGEWKLDRRLGLFFEIDYGQGSLGRMEFGFDVCYNRQNCVTLTLFAPKDEPLGIRLMCTHSFLRTHAALFFARAQHSKQEQRVEAGVRIPF